MAERTTRAPRSRLASTLLVVVLLTAAGDLAYSSSFAGVFIFDDKFAIIDNPNIRTLWPISTAMSAPPETPTSARPVASLTLAINYALAPPDARDVMTPGGPDAPAGTTEQFLRNVWGYHFVNLALHVLAALALFGVVRRTLLTERLRPRLGEVSTPLAFVVALVWLVHPLCTEAVTYVTQRTEVLLGLFYLLTLYCSIRAGEMQGNGPTVRRSDGPTVRPSDSRTFGLSDHWRRRLWIAGAVAACALGMGSKQTMVTAPFVVVAWDWIFGGEASRLRWRLYAALAATWLVVISGVALERWPHSIGIDREGWTPWTYLLTQTGVILHYLRLSLVPAPLALDYDGWPMARSLLQVAPQAAVLIVFVAITSFALVKRQPWGFAGAWFFALLAPSSSVLPLATEIAAERRMYAALPAVVAAGVIGGYLVGRRVLARFVPEARSRRLAGAIAAVVLVGGLVAALATMTDARNRDYSNEEHLWQDTVEKRPDNPRARLNYGVVLSLAQRYPEAEAQLRKAISLKDTDATSHGNLGSVLCSLGRLDEGVAHLERAIALDPEYRPAYGNLGEAYGALGRRDLAAKYFAMAVAREPDNPFLLSRLGWLLATSPEDGIRNGAKAVEVSERAVRLTRRQDVMALDTLAASYAEAGRFDEALATGREAFAVANMRNGPAAAAPIADRLSIYQARQKVREK